MRQIVKLIIFIILFISCNESKEISFEVENKSNDVVDSLKIVLGVAGLVKRTKPVFQGKQVLLRMKSKHKQLDKKNVFVIYYYVNGVGYWSGFGYFTKGFGPKDKYNLYIFNEGVSGIDKKTRFLKENKHKLK